MPPGDPLDLRLIEPAAVPMTLARIHRELSPGDRLRAWLPCRTRPGELSTLQRSILWPFAPRAALLRDVFEGAGLEFDRRRTDRPVLLTRCWTLPDTVGPSMRLLICGLNPSPAAADRGVGFARPGNRFWPAAVAAGLVTVDRDPNHALTQHGIGMTDAVKRTTRRADELSVAEYRAGFARIERLARWLEPTTICFVGLAGWRAAKRRNAVSGWQPTPLGGRPVYLMPSTSGLNATSSLGDLTTHLTRAASRPPAAITDEARDL